MASPRILSYSYKPDTGLEGASTVAPLKNGSFLEVRRGEKTKWSQDEFRNTWESLDAWKATLPAGAVVVEKKAGEDSRSSEFRLIIDTVEKLCKRSPVSINLRYVTNLEKANFYIHLAKGEEVIERLKGNTDLSTCARYVELRNLAIAELSKAPYRIREIRSPIYEGPRQGDIYVQKSNGEFTKLYFELRKGLFAILSPDRKTFKTAPTIKQLGAHPLFQVYTSAHTPQFMTFETIIPSLKLLETGGGAATSAATSAATIIANYLMTS